MHWTEASHIDSIENTRHKKSQWLICVLQGPEETGWRQDILNRGLCYQIGCFYFDQVPGSWGRVTPGA